VSREVEKCLRISQGAQQGPLLTRAAVTLVGATCSPYARTICQDTFPRSASVWRRLAVGFRMPYVETVTKPGGENDEHIALSHESSRRFQVNLKMTLEFMHLQRHAGLGEYKQNGLGKLTFRELWHEGETWRLSQL
jgi:hypothetical protein